MKRVMQITRLRLAVVATGISLAGIACSNLTSPSGEDPDRLSPVVDKPTASAAAPPSTQPQLIRRGADDTAMVRRILISYEGAEKAKPEVKRTVVEARRLAAEISNKLQSPGADFGALAKAHSDAPDAEHGGVVPAFTRDANLDPALKSAAFQTPVGQVSGVITTPQGLLILQRLK
jgi:hypothetical protein